ncbi:hypothetical protein, partial [Klebsiella michiganensis]|uniref:hypothetical protein n=1 Tax=Klebsiella michiganensis TaxID=1134687 RepID=UPI0013D65448
VMNLVIFFAVLGAWWGVCLYTEGQSWAFGGLSWLLTIPVFMIAGFTLGRQGLPSILGLYAAGCVLSALVLLRGRDTTWTLREVLICAA